MLNYISGSRVVEEVKNRRETKITNCKAAVRKDILPANTHTHTHTPPWYKQQCLLKQ